VANGCIYASNLNCGSAAKRIYIYDLAVRQRIVQPVVQLPFADAGAANASSVNVITFNSTIPGMLAAAAGDVINVWQLQQRLVEPRPNEAKLLRRLLDSEDASALLRAQRIVAS